VSTPEQARPALLRGSSVGLLTATLAVAAHGAAGGGVPTPRALLVVVAAAALLGAACTLVPGLRRGTAPLAVVLAAAQYLAHGALELAAGGGHALTASDHAGHAVPAMPAMPATTGTAVVPTGGMAGMSTSPAMLLGHALAVLGCVLLVRRAELVGAAVLAVVRRVLPVAGLLRSAPEPPERPAHRVVPPAPRPGARLVVVGAVPQRGPPAGALSSC
jgi:hypothetical protein